MCFPKLIMIPFWFHKSVSNWLTTPKLLRIYAIVRSSSSLVALHCASRPSHTGLKCLLKSFHPRVTISTRSPDDAAIADRCPRGRCSARVSSLSPTHDSRPRLRLMVVVASRCRGFTASCARFFRLVSCSSFSSCGLRVLRMSAIASRQ